MNSEHLLDAADDALIEQAVLGDDAARGLILERHRDRLKRLVRMRLDPRVVARVDASDVLQEACLEAAQRFDRYLEERPMPFFLWLRFITQQKILQIHRRHLDVKGRDAARESGKERPLASTLVLAERLAGTVTGPSTALDRKESSQRLHRALESMDSLDREIVVMRHFERLTHGEVASELSLTEAACQKRYRRALSKLRDLLSEEVDGA